MDLCPSKISTEELRHTLANYSSLNLPWGCIPRVGNLPAAILQQLQLVNPVQTWNRDDKSRWRHTARWKGHVPFFQSMSPSTGFDRSNNLAKTVEIQLSDKVFHTSIVNMKPESKNSSFACGSRAGCFPILLWVYRNRGIGFACLA